MSCGGLSTPCTASDKKLGGGSGSEVATEQTRTVNTHSQALEREHEVVQAGRAW